MAEDPGAGVSRFSVAKRIRCVFRESVQGGAPPAIYRDAGDTSSHGNIQRRVSETAGEARHQIRRALRMGLTGMCRPFRAKYCWGLLIPRALPWAVMLCPFGAKERAAQAKFDRVRPVRQGLYPVSHRTPCALGGLPRAVPRHAGKLPVLTFWEYAEIASSFGAIPAAKAAWPGFAYAPKGQDKIAQGNALGTQLPPSSSALKARHKDRVLPAPAKYFQPPKRIHAHRD
jgi:hypothetical protein